MRVTPGDVHGWSRRALENGGVTTLALDAGDELLAVGSKNGSIRFVNCESANVDDKKVFERHTGAITALAFVAKTVVSASETGRCASGRSPRARRSTPCSRRVRSCASSRARRAARSHAAADGAGTLVLWDAAQGRERARWTSPTGTPIVAMAFADKGYTLLTAAGTQIIAFELRSK